MFEVGRLVARVTLEGAQTFQRDLKAVKDEWTGMSSEAQHASTTVGQASLGIGTAIAAFAGVAIAKSASFEKAMSSVQAATMASAGDMGLLRDAAIEAGGATVFTAEEAAKAQENLSKAGIQTADILGGALSGSLALAAAGELDVGAAAEIAATAMTQFKLSGKDVPHIADLLAAAAGKAQGDVQDMAFALKQSGLVAAQFGLSVEETTGTLAAFASNGLLGSDAGTSFRTMLLSLANPTGKASDELAKWNINAYDAKGNFVGIASLSEQLKRGLEGQSEATRNSALATIFGSDAIRAANVLYTEGAVGIQDWTDKVNDAGYAADQASTRQDNLAGDVEKLGGAFDSMFITLGSGAQGPLRDLVQGVTEVIDWVSQLPQPLQDTVLTLGLVTGAVLVVGGAMLITIPKIVEFRTAMATLGTQMPKTSAAISAGAGILAGPWGIAITAAITLLSLFAQNSANSKANIASLSSTLDENTGAITKNTKAAAIKRLEDEGVYASAKQAGISIKEVNAAVFEGGDALDAYNAKAAAYTQSFERQSSVAAVFDGANVRLRDNVNNLRSDLDSAKESVDRVKEANESAVDPTMSNAESTQAAADAYLNADDNASGLVDTLTKLVDQINEANGVGQDAVSANITYQDSLSKVNEQIANIAAGTEGYAGGLNTATAAGRDNLGMLNQLAEDSQTAAKAQFDLDHNTTTYTASLAAGRQALYDSAIQMGATADEASALADQVYRIPSAKEIKLLADTATATRQINDWVSMVNGKQVHIAVGVGGAGGITQADGGIVRYYANGGTEQHVAQIARAGVTRVWAEPETQGETYIPWAESKRGRSTAILSQTAEAFGYSLVPHGAQQSAPVVHDNRTVQAPITIMNEDPGTTAKFVSRDLQDAFGGRAS